MTFPKELLEPAKFLSDLDVPGEPKQPNLRRAVSAAYYSQFHLITAEAANNWTHERQRARFTRLFDHGRMKTCCAGFEGRLKLKLGENPSRDDEEAATFLKAIRPRVYKTSTGS